MAGYRPAYTFEEDNTILKIIIDSQKYYSLRGRSFWQDLSALGCLDRTWMSLKNRFHKYILPNISNLQYKIPAIEKRKIQLAIYQIVKYNEIKDSSSEETSSDSESGDETEKMQKKVVKTKI